MDEIVKKFLLAGDKLMPEMHLMQPGLTYSDLRPFLKSKKQQKNLKKQKVHNIFIKTKQIKLVFKMTWLMEILST